MKYLAVIFIWLALAGMVAATAFAWGAEGRLTVLALAIIGTMFASITTRGVMGDGDRDGLRGKTSGHPEAVTDRGLRG